MAIEDIFRALEQQAEDDVQEILEGARAQAEGIEEDAAAEAEEIHERMVGEAESAAKTAAMHKLNAARLQAKKEVAAVKGAAIDKVFEEAEQQLAELRDRGSYEDLLGRLLDEALTGVDGDYTVYVDPRDEDLARRVMSGRDGSLETGVETAGGVVVTTHGDRVARRNTFEDRLDKLRHLSRGRIAEILLES